MKKTPADADNENIKILTDQSFDNQIKKGVTLVDFWAPWCMPCKMMIPVLNELSQDDSHDAIIAKLNVDENQKTAAKYGVRSIPTSIIFKNGKEIKRFVGVKPTQFFVKQIKSI
ncbi:MAG: thioredoxin [Bacteroidales bacterium]|nr:thioredoxin [Bacteroidales bacterium]MDD4216097.1 thioredoxin [Bacteroidales bacterium]